jgi:hypothetical protein
MPADPIIAARLERHLRRIQPDPLFRRRLRGQIVNRYVAAREGMIPVQPVRSGRRQMGALGRGVLYASLLTAVTVTAAAAASQESLPGDAMYGVKLQLEDLRMRIAPPGLRDDLAAAALEERLEEVEKLAESGRWNLVDEAAARVATAEEQLDGLAGPQSSGRGLGRSEEKIEQHVARLAELIATAPASVRPGLERALEATTADGPPGPADASDPAPGHGAQGPASGGQDSHENEPGTRGVQHDGDQGGTSDGQKPDKDQKAPSPD